MPYSLTQIAYMSLRDLGELRSGQTTSADILNDILFSANEMLDGWASDRLFVYTGTSPTFTVLTAFPDLTTSYSFASGYLRLIRKGLAATIAPMMKIYFKIPEPLVEQIGSEYAAARQAVEGQAPQ